MKLTEVAVYHLIQELEENVENQQKSAERCLNKGDATNYTYYQGLSDGMKAAIHYLSLYLLIDDNTHRKRPTSKTTKTTKTAKRTTKRNNQKIL